MTDKEKDAVAPAPANGGAIMIDAGQLAKLAAEGLRLRREFEERIARMKTITAADLQIRSR